MYFFLHVYLVHPFFRKTHLNLFQIFLDISPECFDVEFCRKTSKIVETPGHAKKPGKEYFIDTYSMSYPKEDRARLFEYAMTAGHEDLFSSPNLQRKLQQLCTGIREGFGLKNHEDPLPWEQYLQP